jgi:hypothetical protein
MCLVDVYDPRCEACARGGSQNGQRATPPLESKSQVESVSRVRPGNTPASPG